MIILVKVHLLSNKQMCYIQSITVLLLWVGARKLPKTHRTFPPPPHCEQDLVECSRDPWSVSLLDVDDQGIQWGRHCACGLGRRRRRRNSTPCKTAFFCLNDVRRWWGGICYFGIWWWWLISKNKWFEKIGPVASKYHKIAQIYVNKVPPSVRLWFMQ